MINRVCPPKNLHTIRELVENFKNAPANCIALNMKTEQDYWKITYQKLYEYTYALGNGLLNLGYKKGDRIGLISENRNEWVMTYLGVTFAGLVIVPFDSMLKSDELIHIIENSEAKIIFCSKQYYEKMHDILPYLKSVKKLVVFDKPNDFVNAKIPESTRVSKSEVEVLNFYDLIVKGESLRTSKKDEILSLVIKKDDIAEMIFTSGTTGIPRRVLLSHYNLMANGDGVQQTTDLGPTDNWIIVLPYHHTYPTILGIFVPLITFGMITPIPTLKPNILTQTMKETGATCIPAVPMLIEKIYKRIISNVKSQPTHIRILFSLMFKLSKYVYVKTGFRLGVYLFKKVRRELGVVNLRFFISGGGPIPKDTIEGMEALGLITMQGYGLTETSPVISNTAPMHNLSGSVGLPLANVTVKIDTPDSNGNGEILIKGPNIMQGYYQMPELTATVIDKEGWFHTGDIGYQNEDGYLFITGRLKNVIVTKGGKNIYPEEIENKILLSPYIAEVIAVGKEFPGQGECPYLYLYPNFEAISILEEERKKKFDEKEINELIKKEIRKITDGMAEHKIPKGFEISYEELPKTSSNKVKRYYFNKK